MRGTHSRLGAFAAGALAILALGTCTAEAHTAGPDRTFRSTDLDIHRLHTVAILPAVAVADDPAAERRVERSWAGVYRDANARWITADEVRERFAAAPERCTRLAERIDAQIWRDGALDAATAAAAARALGVDAVLSLRIDRWEVVDGGRAVIALTAVLTDTAGDRLWSIRGTAGYGRGRTSDAGNFSWNLGVLRDPALEPRDDPHRLSLALYNLLARWAPELPTPIQEETILPRLLAQMNED